MLKSQSGGDIQAWTGLDGISRALKPLQSSEIMLLVLQHMVR